MDLKLNDILNISEQNQWKFKVKFNNWTGENPIQTYLRDEEIKELKEVLVKDFLMLEISL